MGELAPARRILRFGAFEVDLAAGELRKQGLRVRLQEKPFQVLTLLLERPGEVVTREELQQRLWPDTFVDFEHSLSTAIKKLRDALGDTADNPRFIETRPGRGYRFLYPVQGYKGRARRRPRHVAALALLALTGIVAMLLALNVGGLRDRLSRSFGSRPAPGEITSIAVLPLKNLSGDPEQDYFADGMTEALITELGKISALRVISRQSTMQFKGTDKPLPEIARELKVDALVEGSAVREGDRVRITAQLVQASPERHLWSETYERDLHSILVLQGDVARKIAGEIRIGVTPEEKARLASARPVNPEAYRLYLRGRYFFWERWPQGLEEAVEYFEQAIEIAPTYAPAYAGLARCYASLGHFQPPQEVFPKAKAAAMKALEMDETLAEAYTSLGHVKQNFDWDWPGAERAFRRAVELNQSSADAHQGYSGYLVRMGRFGEAIAESKRALELAPVSLGANVSSAWVSMKARRYDEAIAQYKKTLELDPDYRLARGQLAWSYALTGMYAEALAEYKKLGEPSGDPVLGFVLAVSGRRSQALKVLENVRRLSAEEYVGPFYMAILYAGLGDKDLALESLEKAYEVRSPAMPELKIAPWFDGLRSNPRFQALLRRMNFPP